MELLDQTQTTVPGQIVEHDLGRPVGTNTQGGLTTWIRVVIVLDIVRTASPF